jgi:nucleoside-diphosphate-sugar epimerase
LTLPGGDLSFVPPGARVLYSIPPLEPDPIAEVIAELGSRIRRLVYLSTTGVYGRTRDVDENTPAAPVTVHDHARVAAESAVMQSSCSSMVLRPAAIYGRDRGVHISVREGRFRLAGDGANFTSRIHVQDLAAIADAALFSDATGAWPVADDYPCTSREIAPYCAELAGVPLPPPAHASELHHSRRANRRVDGRAIRALLRVDLEYPTYRDAISQYLGALRS